MFNFSAKSSSQTSKRLPTYAGSWYEGDGKKLKTQLDSLLVSANQRMESDPVDLSFANNPAPCRPILAIVVPHAGYMFSGQTAAYAYKVASNSKIKRVFLLGPSHYIGFEGGVLPVESTFATPVGDLKVDREIVDELCDYPLFHVSQEIHRREHSLEMQLPFIREALGDVQIVPIIIGNLTDETEITLIGQVLRRYIKDGDLVVVSSDFTHFGPRYQYEPFTNDIKENVRKLDSEAFHHLSELDLKGFLEFRKKTDDTICGFYPCSVLMALLPPGSRGSLLNYRTSQDSLVEDDRNSVSYLAIVFSNQSGTNWQSDAEAARPAALSENDKKILLGVARQSLESYVRDHKPSSAQSLKQYENEALKRRMGVFVTLYKRASKAAPDTVPDRTHKELRGCIGYIWPVKPLWLAVAENAVGACSRDYRFKPVEPQELENIDIDINVLSEPKRVSSYNDIVVGRDGVIMYKNGKQAVFLPSVATEYNWDLNELLTQLSLKAGCGPDDWKIGARFDVFQAESFEESEL